MCYLHLRAGIMQISESHAIRYVKLGQLQQVCGKTSYETIKINCEKRTILFERAEICNALPEILEKSRPIAFNRELHLSATALYH